MEGRVEVGNRGNVTELEGGVAVTSEAPAQPMQVIKLLAGTSLGALAGLHVSVHLSSIAPTSHPGRHRSGEKGGPIPSSRLLEPPIAHLIGDRNGG